MTPTVYTKAGEIAYWSGLRLMTPTVYTKAGEIAYVGAVQFKTGNQVLQRGKLVCYFQILRQTVS